MFYFEYLPPYMQNKYFQSLIVIVAFVILTKLILVLFKNIFSKLVLKTKTDVDDLIVKKIRNPIFYILIILGVKTSVIPLNIQNGFAQNLNIILNSIIVIIITYMISKTLSIIVDGWGKEWSKRTNSSIDDGILPLIHKAISAVIWIFGGLYLLNLWGISIGPFLASLGIAGIAIGFAVKDSLANIFGGIQLILDKSIKVGDTVKLEKGDTGKVMDVGLRSTRVRNWDNEVIIIPNGQLANTSVVNYAQPDLSAREVVNFGVEYGSDPDKVKKVAMGVIKKVKTIVNEPEPFVRFINMGDFSLDFKLYFWVADYRQRFMTKDIVMTSLYRELKKAKIGIPFPTRTLYMHKKK
ncbi:mechanosensitive ion channel [Candidatus Woesearchaeota archaeon]|nr:mechanosensitive ion channel [Candidatus Woesearchaeota archaeon]